MAAALSRVYAGLCRRDRLTSKECPFWLYLFCGNVHVEHYIKHEVTGDLVVLRQATHRKRQDGETGNSMQ